MPPTTPVNSPAPGVVQEPEQGPDSFPEPGENKDIDWHSASGTPSGPTTSGGGSGEKVVSNPVKPAPKPAPAPKPPLNKEPGNNR